MKRSEAIKAIGAILDKIEDSGHVVKSLTIKRTLVTEGFAVGRTPFEKRIVLEMNEIIDCEAVIVQG